MPTVYRVEILNHLVDSYEDAQEKLRSAEKWLVVCASNERAVWDRYESRLDANSPSTLVRNEHDQMRRKMVEATRNRNLAESDRDAAKISEQRAMRTLCDAVLLAAKGSLR